MGRNRNYNGFYKLTTKKTLPIGKRIQIYRHFREADTQMVNKYNEKFLYSLLAGLIQIKTKMRYKL